MSPPLNMGTSSDIAPAPGVLTAEAPDLTRIERAARWWRDHDGLLYAGFAVLSAVYAASVFYGYMMVQTHGRWSAPLDDVFIHFDYARSFARGYPFQWSEGNGYSSGNTSLTYPIVLALGYWMGFRDMHLMVWAALIAIASVAAFLTCAGMLAVEGERWTRFLMPPAVLSLGALDWTLFSGMENAFHLALWGACLALTLHQTRATDARSSMRRAWLFGAAGALLVGTRPESVVCVAAFGIFCAWKRSGRRERARVLLATGAPAAVLLVLQGVVNLLLTGEWSQNGAIAKLFVSNPFMSASDMAERYFSLLAYIIPRLTQHHFSQHLPFGWLIPLLALLPLASRPLRPFAVLLWAQIIAWMLVVALNNQLRWHNERYAMPAVAWLLVLAALGVGVLAMRSQAALAHKTYRYRLAAALGVMAVYWIMQAPRMKDQIWFFGRASRNILDQHVTAGRLLRELDARRVLVGDAGALMYASDRPGLDLIGLGGYHAYPFARSTVHGLGASLELIERMPEGDRPDVMAIYPSWWGDLPVLFGRFVAAVPVYGNVICGGPEKVIYAANWSALDRQGKPRSLRQGERVVDELDIADLLSEGQHGYNFPSEHVGFVRYRVLTDPDEQHRDLFDAGRIIPDGFTERAKLLAGPSGGGRLIVRVAPEQTHRVEVTANGQPLGELSAEPRTAVWQELSVRLPADLRGHFELGLTSRSGEVVHFHVWVVEAAP